MMAPTEKQMQQAAREVILEKISIAKRKMLKAAWSVLAVVVGGGIVIFLSWKANTALWDSRAESAVDRHVEQMHGEAGE